MSETKKTNALDSILKQYEESNAPKSTSTTAKTYDLKNYFNTFLKEGIKSGVKRVRILPTSDGSSPFVVMHGHKATVDGEHKTFPCLKHEKNEACPFCEAREVLLATGREDSKEMAKKYNSRKMYVVKVIDRDNEQDGVKFWRFNHDYRKEGIYDKIYGVLVAIGKDITDTNTGRDLVIQVNRNTSGAPVVSSVATSDPTPLSVDTESVKLWTSDTRTWEDVYSVRTYNYLEIIVKGGTPFWDKDAKKFVDKASIKNNTEAEVTMGVENVKASIKAATPTPAPVTAQTPVTAGSEEATDDLPF